MDWDRVIERNHAALKRILAALVAMAGFSESPPMWGRCPAGQRGASRAETPAGQRPLLSAPTLPRHRYRAILRLLRPAESAARRLIVVAARDLAVTLPPARPRRQKQPSPKPAHAALRNLGIAVVMSPADIARAEAAERAADKARRARATRPPLLPLLDPLRRVGPPRPRTVPPHAAPRILFPGVGKYHALPPPPTPHDPIDATSVARRLAALHYALDDLPAHALRFARWKARRDALARRPFSPQAGRGGATRNRRMSPLRAGRPPGQKSQRRRRNAHEIYEVLADLHYFAYEVLNPPDTS